MGKKRFSVSFVFSSFVCLIPILEYYKSPIPMFNMATFLAIIFGFYILATMLPILRCRKNGKHNIASIFAFSYLVFITINCTLSIVVYGYGFSFLGIAAWVRLVVLLFSLVIIGGSCFSIDCFDKALHSIVALSSFVIIFQFLIYSLTGVRLRLVIPSLLMDEGYGVAGDRFSAFFMEPAHFAQSASIFLIIELFLIKKKRTFSIVLTIVGIILSGSGQGYLFLLIIFAVWLIKQASLIKRDCDKLLIPLVALSLSAFFVLLVSQLPYVQNAASRVISSDGTLGGTALLGRVGSGTKFYDLTEKQKWMGVGFGHLSDVTTLYVTSFYTHLIECGYFSIPLLAIIAIPSLFGKSAYSRSMSLLFMLLIFIASGANPMTLSYFLLLMYSKSTLKKIESNKCFNNCHSHCQRRFINKVNNEVLL